MRKEQTGSSGGQGEADPAGQPDPDLARAHGGRGRAGGQGVHRLQRRLRARQLEALLLQEVPRLHLRLRATKILLPRLPHPAQVLRGGIHLHGGDGAGQGQRGGHFQAGRDNRKQRGPYMLLFMFKCKRPLIKRLSVHSSNSRTSLLDLAWTRRT